MLHDTIYKYDTISNAYIYIFICMYVYMFFWVVNKMAISCCHHCFGEKKFISLIFLERVKVVSLNIFPSEQFNCLCLYLNHAHKIHLEFPCNCKGNHIL